MRTPALVLTNRSRVELISGVTPNAMSPKYSERRSLPTAADAIGKLRSVKGSRSLCECGANKAKRFG